MSERENITADIRFAVAQRKPKRCTGCGLVQPAGDFPTSTAHGKTIIRSKCTACMNAYYRERHGRLKVQRRTPA